ncbi:hypothetical protein [Calidifontibacillus erzurumensis]|uniref:Double zinc ribbon protein n=1 Tax=Calidifontibacillus erzurumensis TaxID=2741433 RepID=A0A8J8GBL2_9BACI|nr:hypothetical protein [Calidifontibacillus erzurumensis]NSL50925.1 hypothetical protein [Calidifontibacillus erzurumensis]
MSDKKEEKICKRCLFKADEKDQYCIRCGAPLINRCTDFKTGGKHYCGFVNRPDARYCAKCGHETVFKQYGLV